MCGCPHCRHSVFSSRLSTLLFHSPIDREDFAAGRSEPQRAGDAVLEAKVQSLLQQVTQLQDDVALRDEQLATARITVARFQARP